MGLMGSRSTPSRPPRGEGPFPFPFNPLSTSPRGGAVPVPVNVLISVLFSVDGIIYCLPDDEEVQGETPVLNVPDILSDTSLHLP